MGNMDLTVLDDDAVTAATPWLALIDAIRDAFRHDGVSPARHHHCIPGKDREDTTVLLMPAWNRAGDFGVKLATVAPSNSALGLPTLHGVYALFGLCVGVPAENPVPRPRLPVEAVLFRDRFPDDEELLSHIQAYDEEYAKYLGARSATPGAVSMTWSERIAQKAGAAVRDNIAAYYTRKGARLD